MLLVYTVQQAQDMSAQSHPIMTVGVQEDASLPQGFHYGMKLQRLALPRWRLPVRPGCRPRRCRSMRCAGSPPCHGTAGSRLIAAGSIATPRGACTLPCLMSVPHCLCLFQHFLHQPLQA